MMFLSAIALLRIVGDVSPSTVSALWGAAAIVVAASITGFFGMKTTRMVSLSDQKKTSVLDFQSLQSEVARLQAQVKVEQDANAVLEQRLDESLSREKEKSVDLDLKTFQIASLQRQITGLREQVTTLRAQLGSHDG